MKGKQIEYLWDDENAYRPYPMKGKIIDVYLKKGSTMYLVEDLDGQKTRPVHPDTVTKVVYE